MGRKVKLFIGLLLVIGIAFWLANRRGLFRLSAFSAASSVPAATQPMAIAENASPPPTSAVDDNDASTFIALRYDKTHVLFRLGDSGGFYVQPEVEAMFHKLPASISKYGGAETSEPDAKIWDSIREHFDQAHVGEQWLLELSAGSRIPVTVQKPIELEWGCDYHSYSAGFIVYGERCERFEPAVLGALEREDRRPRRNL